MLIALIAVSISLVAVAAAAAYRERRYQTIIADLLDRVMARDYGEYNYGRVQTAAKPKPRARAPYNDEELARLEKGGRFDLGAVAAGQEVY